MRNSNINLIRFSRAEKRWGGTISKEFTAKNWLKYRKSKAGKIIHT